MIETVFGVFVLALVWLVVSLLGDRSSEQGVAVLRLEKALEKAGFEQDHGGIFTHPASKLAATVQALTHNKAVRLDVYGRFHQPAIALNYNSTLITETTPVVVLEVGERGATVELEDFITLCNQSQLPSSSIIESLVYDPHGTFRVRTELFGTDTAVLGKTVSSLLLLASNVLNPVWADGLWARAFGLIAPGRHRALVGLMWAAELRQTGQADDEPWTAFAETSAFIELLTLFEREPERADAEIGLEQLAESAWSHVDGEMFARVDELAAHLSRDQLVQLQLEPNRLAQLLAAFLELHAPALDPELLELLHRTSGAAGSAQAVELCSAVGAMAAVDARECLLRAALPESVGGRDVLASAMIELALEAPTLLQSDLRFEHRLHELADADLTTAPDSVVQAMGLIGSAASVRVLDAIAGARGIRLQSDAQLQEALALIESRVRTLPELGSVSIAGGSPGELSLTDDD